MTNSIAISSLRAVAAKVLRLRPFACPSEWMAANCWVSGAMTGTGYDTRFDPWYFPCNVGIVDAYTEGKRGMLVQKAVQMGVSQYMQNLCLYIMARVGGPTGYSMAKDETMRDHVLDRFDVTLEHSDELRELYLPGRDNHETIRSKRFLNGTLKCFGAGTPNNFKSNPYLSFFADEFELMPVFPDGSYAVLLALGRQAAFSWPFFAGWSTPLEADAERGIEAAIETESDRRLFWWRCPACREPITVNFLDNVKFDRAEGSNAPLNGTARLLCPKCGHAITDYERAIALVDAARRSSRWYCAAHDLELDQSVGWLSSLDPADAATRRYAGFTNLDHLHSPHKRLDEIAAAYLAITSEPARKTFFNDTLGRGYTMRTRQLARGDIEATIAEAKRTAIPAGTMWITFGSDVQGGGADQRRSVFYYDIAAWVRGADNQIRKVTLFLDRITSTEETGHETIKSLLRSWTATDERGNARRLDMAVIDGTFRAPVVNAICNAVSSGGTQWVIPCVYGSRKPGEADYEFKPQNELVGDPGRAFLLTSRSYLVGRYVNLIHDEHHLVELPGDVPEEVISHYLANEMVKEPDRNGVMRDVWRKRKADGGRLMDDDWFAAGCYSLMAAILMGFDREQTADIVEARADADAIANRRIEQARARSPAEARRRQRLHERMARRFSG